jgi:hypothetical protein
MGERWEYKIIYFGVGHWTSTGLPSDLNEEFNEYAAQGWELVGTESIERPSLIPCFIPWGGSKTVGVVGYFKRRVSQDGA